MKLNYNEFDDKSFGPKVEMYLINVNINKSCPNATLLTIVLIIK